MANFEKSQMSVINRFSLLDTDSNIECAKTGLQSNVF